MNKSHQQIKRLTTKEVQRMSNDEIIEYVQIEQKRLKVPVNNVWDEIIMKLKEEIADEVISENNNPSDFRHTFSGNEWIMNVTITYVLTFGLIWLLLYNFMENKFNALQFIIITCGVASISITATFLHLSRKGERSYMDAVNNLKHLQEARSIYVYRRGFKDSSDKTLGNIKDDD